MGIASLFTPELAGYALGPVVLEREFNTRYWGRSVTLQAVRKSIEQHRQRWGEGVGYLERETFDTFLQLPAPQRRLIREVILTFAKAHALPQKDSTGKAGQGKQKR